MVDDDRVLVGRADGDVVGGDAIDARMIELVDSILAINEVEGLATGAFDDEAAGEVAAFDDEAAGEVAAFDDEAAGKVAELTTGAFDEAAGVVELPTTPN
jgi:hypothetical protein